MILYTDQHPPVIIAAVPQVPETYYNCEIIFNTLDLNKISFQISTDLNLANTLLGMTSHASKFPCPYGLCSKDDEGFWVQGEDRTIRGRHDF